MMNLMKPFKINWIKYVLMACCLTAPLAWDEASAWAQSIDFETSASEINAGVPFQLTITVSDVDRSPTPVVEPFTIENAQVTPMGTSSSVSIINGVVNVQYKFSFTIVPETVGHYVLPQIKVTQGSKSFESQKRVSFDASDVALSRDMRIELELPDRALWVGESFDAYINWYVRKDFSSQEFTVPFLSLGDYFDIAEADPTVTPNLRNVIPVVSGGRQFLFPYTRDKATVGGVDYTRFRMRVTVTPKQTGEVKVPATSVVAKLEAGMTRDYFGFPSVNYEFKKATDIDRTLTVKALPTDQRPDSFSNALGTQYEIAVQADRTIIRVGDPIVLTIDIISPKGMDGLILPNLAKAGLNEDLFNVSEDYLLPEKIDAGNGRTIQRFQVPVRVRSERVREIPPIAFSYFDLKRENYVTVRSQPIALTVSAAEKVGAEDVVMNAATAGAMASSNGQKQDGDAARPAKAPATSANSGLQLGLETAANDLHRADASALYRVLEALAYGLPFLCWIGLGIVRRSRKKSALDKPQREAVFALKAALDNAKTANANAAAAQISNALTAMCVETETDKKPFMAIMEEIDSEAYRPGAGKSPLDAKNVDALREAVKTHAAPKYAKLIRGILGILIAFACFVGTPEVSIAQEPVAVAGVEQDDGARLSAAQTAYHEAMQKATRSEQVASFSYAATIFRDLAGRYPHEASLYMDWGNAAFNASDYGSASLAWRRALRVDPTLTKAKNNLDYIDSLQDFGQKKENAALSSFFFLNDTMVPAERLLWAAIFFFVAAMLCVPWSEAHKRLMRLVAIIPFLIWLWFLASVGMQDSHDQDAVVMQEVSLRNADNPGAASVLPSMIEPGALVEVVQERGEWTFVRLQNGVQGWMSRSAVERVAAK